MPPEPLPWDRKDLFREKKHNGGYDRVSEPLGGSGARWRDMPSHGSRNDFGRWGYPSDFRRPPGHGKQGGWHMYPEDMSHGYVPARSGDRFFQDGGGFRPSGPYRDGRYNRNFRESRASLIQRDWRGNSWDYNHHHGPPSSGPGRFYDGKDQKSVDGAPVRLSRPQLDVANTSNLVRTEEQRAESSDVSKAVTCQRVEKEESLASDWKPFKWSRPGNLTPKGSALNFSSSSKGASESCDVKIELPLKISTPDESYSSDALGCLASPTSLDDTSSRKKPRLGWGEGLAKYERKKGPDDSETKSPSALCTSNVDSMQSPTQNSAHKSPRIGGSFDCRSPTTPSSVAYSSSPGLDFKSYTKAEIDIDANNLSISPTPREQNQFEVVPLDLENMEVNSFCNLNGLLTERIQKEERRSVDSGSIKSALNTLLSWKGDISKVLELTESEIDSLENEFKALKSRPGNNSAGAKSLSSMSVECKEKVSDELNIKRSHSLPAVSPGNVTTGEIVPYGKVVEEALTKTKDGCVDSPGTATSRFTEFLSSDKTSSPNHQKHGLSVDMVSPEEACTSVQNQNTAGSSGSYSEAKVTEDAIAASLGDVAVCDNMEDNSFHYILVSNKEAANKASKLLGNLLPSSSCDIESIEAISSTWSQNNELMERFLKRKRSLGFKERVLSMKYKAFRYMWKEDLQLSSERMYRTKSQKKVESGSRSLHSGFQKHRSSIRSRVTSPACTSSSLLPTPDAVNFTSKLLSDPQMRCYRNDMRMPALILDKKEKVLSRFLSDNGLVQDSCAVERERTLINPWTAEEKNIFLDNYATFGKDFTRISSFLDHKTTADCIEFYYKNHKSDCFKKAKKLRKQKTSAPTMRYLMTSEKKWSKEMNAASLDMLGAASVIVARDDKGIKSAKASSVSGRDRKLRGKGLRETSSSYTIEDERETEAADVLAGICGSLSSEAMSSCITSSADPGEGTQDWKSRKTSSEPSGSRCLPTAEVTQNVDDDTCSDESCGNVEPVDWTDEEKSNFVQAFSAFGKDFVMISRRVSTKSRDQCKVFFSKARKCLGLELGLCNDPCPGDEEMQTTDPEGRSDTEDACVVENELAISNGDKLSDGTDENTPITSNIKHDENDMNLHEKANLSDEFAPAMLDEKDLKGRLKDQDCLQEDAPDDGSVLNETVENVPTNGHDDTVMAEAATDLPKTVTSVTNHQYKIGAEIAIEKVETDMNCGILDNRDEPLKRSTSASDLHQYLHGQTFPDLSTSCPMANGSSNISRQIENRVACTFPFVPRTVASVQPLQVYLKKCQRSASVQPSESGTHLQQHSADASEKPSCRKVKLFGQILSKSSNTDKPVSEIHVNSSSSGCEDVPARKYGFWDGSRNENRIQTGCSSVPDSTMLVARYPAIFGSPRLSTSTSEQQLSELSELSVNGNKSSLTSVGNYHQQVYPVELDKIQIQPMRLMEMKQQEIFPKVPKNGFEAVPGLQQIELNVLETEARPCLLTDPVAALKLHYAKAHQHGGSQNGDVGR